MTINGARNLSAARPVVRFTLRRMLLLSGMVSSILYVATDVLGALVHDGYSVTSQAISELMAVGAPSEPVVDPLFLSYGMLVLLFGIGVLREGVARARAVTISGALLITYAAVGLTGPTLFEMHPRGTASLEADRPHIVLTGILSLLLLLIMGFGGFALGRRFRIYSLATVATIIALGVILAPMAGRLAAGQPTPGFGIIERVSIYASLLWIAMFGVTLLRRVHNDSEAFPHENVPEPLLRGA